MKQYSPADRPRLPLGGAVWWAERHADAARAAQAQLASELFDDVFAAFETVPDAEMARIVERLERSAAGPAREYGSFRAPWEGGSMGAAGDLDEQLLAEALTLLDTMPPPCCRETPEELPEASPPNCLPPISYAKLIIMDRRRSFREARRSAS